MRHEFENMVELALLAVSAETPVLRVLAENDAYEQATKLGESLAEHTGRSHRGVAPKMGAAITWGKSGFMLKMWKDLRGIESWVERALESDPVSL